MVWGNSSIEQMLPKYDPFVQQNKIAPHAVKAVIPEFADVI